MIITLDNIQEILAFENPVKRSRVVGYNSKPRFQLLESLEIKLSNEKVVIIPEGFRWDLSSSPRIVWAILPPDGDFELGSLIHDYLYKTKLFSRKFADREMLKWSKKTNTTNKISLRKIDNYVRFFFVRILGWLAWDLNFIKL